MLFAIHEIAINNLDSFIQNNVVSIGESDYDESALIVMTEAIIDAEKHI